MKGNLNIIDKSLIETIKQIVITARENVYKTVNNELLLTYWQIG